MNWQLVGINAGIALVSVVLIFGVRALIAYFSTKDYFDKHVRAAQVLGFQERQVPVRDGLVLNVAEGPPGDTPLLLIPGQGSVWQEYCKTLPHLSQDFHVLVVDVHGHGKSTWDPVDYTADQIAEDLAELVQQVFAEPALVAGHPSGGLIAAVMAARHPEQVRGVLFEDPLFFSTEPDRVPKTYVGIDAYPSVESFLSQDQERDWVCWYMPRSYQAQTLRAITCPTVFLKATTRYDREGNLLAALSDEDLARVEQLLRNNRTIRVRSSHDVHFARTSAYVAALRQLSAAAGDRH